MKTTIFVTNALSDVSDGDYYGAVLLFNSEVVFKKRVVVYDLFNFVVDVGSSLGLWLGLSMLNISDAVLDFFYNLNLKKIFQK